MFGYLQFHGNKKSIYYNQFKKNYCYLCKCLGKNCGLMIRCILSFDITFFLMTVTEESYLSKVNKISCFKKLPKEYYETEVANKIASLNLFLSMAKIEDNILDEKNLIAYIGKLFLLRSFKKAKEKHQTMWYTVDSGYKKIRELESKNSSVQELETAFSNIICDIAKNEFHCNDSNRLSILEFTTKWIYFIDAYDDYDKDIKKRRFNPLKFESLNERLHFFNIHMSELYEIIKEVKTIKDKNFETVSLIVTDSVEKTNYGMLKNKRSSI